MIGSIENLRSLKFANTICPFVFRFFELDPSAQNEFPCKGESLAALKTNALLGQHGAKFMEYITTAVNGLDDYAGKAHGPLTDLGTRHKTRGTTPANFGVSRSRFMSDLRDLGGRGGGSLTVR